MIFGHFLTNNNESNLFIVGCEKTREALVVDAAEWGTRMTHFVQAHQLTIRAVFITHDHYDHTGALKKLLQQHHATVYAGAPKPGGCKATVLRHDDSLQVGELQGKAVALPGHTPDSIGLILSGMAFTGDALFSGSVGGTGSQQQAQQQIDGIQKHLFPLPDDYQVHTGHGPSSTIAIERTYNPFFQ
jgi:hydroxyacylglutathione hydrolase